MQQNVRRFVGLIVVAGSVVAIQCSNEGSTPFEPSTENRPALFLDGRSSPAASLVPASHDGFPVHIDFEIKDFECGESVTNQYAHAGVLFSGRVVAGGTNDCLNASDYPPHSPQHVIVEEGTGTFRMDLAFTTDGVGLRSISFGSLTLSCFTASDVLVGSDIGPGDNLGGPHDVVRVTGADIRYCTVTGTPGFYIVDDLFFESGFDDGASPEEPSRDEICRGTILESLIFIENLISVRGGILRGNVVPYLLHSLQLYERGLDPDLSRFRFFVRLFTRLGRIPPFLATTLLEMADTCLPPRV